MATFDGIQLFDSVPTSGAVFLLVKPVREPLTVMHDGWPPRGEAQQPCPCRRPLRRPRVRPDVDPGRCPSQRQVRRRRHAEPLPRPTTGSRPRVLGGGSRAREVLTTPPGVAAGGADVTRRCPVVSGRCRVPAQHPEPAETACFTGPHVVFSRGVGCWVAPGRLSAVRAPRCAVSRDIPNHGRMVFLTASLATSTRMSLIVFAVPTVTFFSNRTSRLDATCACGVSFTICSTLSVNSFRSSSS